MNPKRLWRWWRAWRKVKPIVEHLRREDVVEKVKSRKFWITIIVGFAGVVASALGVPEDQWGNVSEWLLKLLMAYFGANAVEHVASAVAAKKNGNGA